MIVQCVNVVYLIYQNKTTMNNNIKLREEWRQLNLKIAQIQKVITQNTKAGQVFTEEYFNWLNELINRRDYLTTQI